MSYPNQRIVIIHKEKKTNNFLQIENKSWQEASIKLKPAAFKIYLLLASNANDFHLELSQAYVEKVLQIKKTAYHDGLNQLEQEGYLSFSHNNTYIFTESPQKRTSAKTDSEVRKSGVFGP